MLVQLQPSGCTRKWLRYAAVLSVAIGVPIVTSVGSDDRVLPSDPVTSRRDSLPTISVRGICLDDAQKPIAEVEVRLYAMRFCTEILDLVKSSRTGQDGRFDLGEFPKPGLPGVHVGVVGKPELPKGPIAYRVVLIKKTKAVQIIPIPGHRPETIEAVMTPGAKLVGAVVGPGNRPVVGATVWVAGFEGMSDVGVATTDESGRFTIPDMTPWQSDVNMTANGAEPISSRTLVVRHRDFGSKQCPFHACPATVDVEVVEPSVVEGTVTNIAGQPQPDVQVAARTAVEGERRGRSAWAATAITDAKGRYRLQVQGAETIDLYVWDPKFISNRLKSLSIAPGKTHQAAVLTTKPRSHWAED